jgi:DNA-binding Lrp family transcriptional regulator
MVESPFEIDDMDKALLNVIQQNPSADVSDLAERLNKSENVIGSRILKLERRDLLSTIRGINAKKIEISLASAEISTKNPIAVMNKLRNCPYVVNAFRKTGTNDVLVMFASKEIASTDEILNKCYRTDPNIKTIDVSYIFEPMKDFVFPINFAVGGDVVCRNECNPIKSINSFKTKTSTTLPKPETNKGKSSEHHSNKEEFIEVQ